MRMYMSMYMSMLRHKFWLYPALVADLGHLSQLAVWICVDMSDGQAMVRTEMTEMEACGEFYLTAKARAVSCEPQPVCRSCRCVACATM